MNHLFRIILMIAATFAVAVSARTAELRLHQQCTPTSSLVTLGDLAEIIAADAGEAESLKRIDLFPAPASDRPRVLRVRELQDLLALRGVNLAAHRFSGAAQVQIVSENRRADPPEQPLNEHAAKRAQRRVQEAILAYLKIQSPTGRPPVLQFDLTAAQQRTAANFSLPITVRGGNPPWSGVQRFEVSIAGGDGRTDFPLDVRVRMPSLVVAALHALPRGAIVQAADVTLVHGDPRDEGENGAFRAVEEVVGKQTTKTIVEGKVLAPDAVKAPLMVRRGDVVTVYAKAAGIRIHTTARAKDDGALGDLVAVESLADRKSFTARVCGPRETEVFAQAARAE
ncbi:MAG: flagellar basal body P-ring formation protein FlgA [Pirellulales bacterium]|nr:flagellar basal body P-ring formation protein FlgA [Pirellulales bacterium]